MKKPNIVFVLTDQWRAQAFGYAGDANVKTPEIDALAARSLNFENAVSVCPVCTPQRAALLTGRFPTSTGMFMNDLYLPKEELCMAEIFRDGGYDTGYIGKWHLDGHGRDSYIPKERRQGFDYWKVLECTHEYNESCYYAGDDSEKKLWEGYDAYAQTDDAKTYIRDHAGAEKPFLLFVGYGGPHFPHHSAPEELKALYPPERLELRPNVPPEQEERTRTELQGYYGHCTAIDTCVGDLCRAVEEAGIAEETIFIFTSDHGDMHGSQGMRSWRKQVPWDESVCVPFLCLYPAVHEGGRRVKGGGGGGGGGGGRGAGGGGRRVKPPLNTPDILPSLLALAGIPIPETVEGKDMSRLFSGSGAEEDRYTFFMNVAPFAGVLDFKAYRGIRNSRHTYVRDCDGPWLLYDNEADPYQMKNLVDDPGSAALLEILDGELQAQLTRNGDRVMTREEAVEEWGYNVEKGGAIPYCGEFRVQSPGPDSGELCRF